MRVGGNKKCREFFETSPEYSKKMSIQDKVRKGAGNASRVRATMDG